MAIYSTNFLSNTIGAIPSDWTDAFPNAATHTFIVESLASGGRVLHATSSSTNTGDQVLTWNAVDSDPARADVEILVRARSTTAPASKFFPFYLYARAKSTAPVSYYLADYYTSSAAGNPSFRGLGSWVSPTEIYFGDVVATAPIVSQYYWLRFRVQSNVLSFKVWAEDVVEPVAWDTTIVNNTITAAGSVGVGLSGNSPSTEDTYFTHVSVGTAGDSPKLPIRTVTTSVDVTVRGPNVPTQNYAGSIYYGAWGGTPYGFMPGGSTPNKLAVTYTITHTVDTTIKTRPVAIHTTDVTVRKQLTTSNTLDVTVRGQLTTSHTADATIRAQRTTSSTVDVTTRAQLNTTSTVDTTVRGQIQATHSVDIQIRATAFQASQTVDTVVRAPHTLDITLDTSVAVRYLAVQSLDVSTYGRYSTSHTTDTTIRAPHTLDHTSDVTVGARISTGHTSDVTVAARLAVAHTLDTTVKTQRSVLHTLDTAVYAQSFITHFLDTAVRRLVYVIHTIDVMIRPAYYFRDKPVMVQPKPSVPIIKLGTNSPIVKQSESSVVIISVDNTKPHTVVAAPKPPRIK